MNSCGCFYCLDCFKTSRSYINIDKNMCFGCGKSIDFSKNSNKHFWFYFSVKINFLKHSKVFVLVWGVLLHGDFLVSKLELLDLIFNIFNLKITLLLLNVKTWGSLAQWRLNLINLLSLRAIRLSSWNIFIWLVVH